MLDITTLGVEVKPKGIDATNKKLDRLGDTASRVEQRVGNAGKKISEFGGNLTKYLTLPLGAGAVASFKFASSLEKQQKVFDVLIGDLEKSSKLFAEIQSFSAKTPFQLEDLTKSTEQLLATGTAVADITDKLNILGNVALGDAEKLARLTDAYGKLQTKGKASLEEINRFTEAGVPILDQLAKNLNVSKDELFDFISAGKLGFKDVDKALTDLATGTGKFAGLLEEVSNTSSGKLSTAIDNVKLSLADLGKEFIPVATEMIDGITQLAKDFRELDQGTKDAIITFGKYAIILPVIITGVGKLTSGVVALSKAFKVASASNLVSDITKYIGGLKDTRLAFEGLTKGAIGFKKVSAEFITAGYGRKLGEQLQGLSINGAKTGKSLLSSANAVKVFGRGIVSLAGAIAVPLGVGGAFFGLLKFLGDNESAVSKNDKVLKVLTSDVDKAKTAYDNYRKVIDETVKSQKKLTDEQKKAIEAQKQALRPKALETASELLDTKELERQARVAKGTADRLKEILKDIRSGTSFEEASSRATRLGSGITSGDVGANITELKNNIDALDKQSKDFTTNLKARRLALTQYIADTIVNISDLRDLGYTEDQLKVLKAEAEDYRKKRKAILLAEANEQNKDIKEVVEKSYTTESETEDFLSKWKEQSLDKVGKVAKEFIDAQTDILQSEISDPEKKLLLKSLLENSLLDSFSLSEGAKANIANKLIENAQTITDAVGIINQGIAKSPIQIGFEESEDAVNKSAFKLGEAVPYVDELTLAVDRLNESMKTTFVDGLQNTYLDTFGALGEAFGSNTSGLDAMSNAIKKNATAILSSLGPMFTRAGIEAITQGILKDRPDLISLGSGLLATGALSSFSAGVVRGEQGTGSFANNQKEVVTTTPQQGYTGGSNVTKFSPNINVINNTGARVDTRTDASGNIEVIVNNMVMSGMQSGYYAPNNIQPKGRKV